MKHKTSLFLSGAVMAMVVSTPAFAQADAVPPQESEVGQLADIVVTAQRRNERLQDVPVSVSAVTATAMTNSGIKGLDSLQVSIPALSVQNANGYLTLHLRGVGSLGNGPGFENPIALYVDGVYLANQSVGLAQFNNVDRIEVLKGPQGTLFGRNATGGLIHIITRDPSSGPLVSGNLSYGNYNAVDAQFYAGAPVSDTLAADIAVRYARNDGWGTNLVNGKDVYRTDHDVALRSKIVFDPGFAKFTLIGDYTDRDGSPNPLTNTPGTRTVPGGPINSYPRPWDARTDTQPRIRVKGGGASLKIQVPLGDMELSNIAAYREAELDNTFDYDGSPLPITFVRIQQNDWQFSNELQLSSGSGSPFTWVAGAYYFRGRGSAKPIAINFANIPAFNPVFPVGTINILGFQDTEAVSGYAQGTLRVTDQLGLTTGFRYSWEKRHLDARQDGVLLLPGSPVVPVTPQTVKDISFERPTFRVSLDYKPTSDLLLYASFNTGFKSGGFNVTTPTDAPYRQETLTAWEIGEKADLFDRRLRINSALFLYEYKDLQVQVAQAAGTGFTNGASARIYGFDGEATLRVGDSLEVNGGLTLLHPTFLNFPNAPTSLPGGGFPVITGPATGNDLPYAARTTFSIGGTYTANIGQNPVVANVTWLHSSSYYFEADNVQKEAPFDTVNASLTMRFDDERFSVGVFGNNLTNAAVRSSLLTIPSGQVIHTLAPPRTYGVRVGFKFGR
ncbi:TonB-dependent receptor [Novosphingobium sp.]|uniref:TonB-dependent receptor n=1 Tax=Novosphingobium sp. TaxID=1874826 RepID=UPI003564DDD6